MLDYLEWRGDLSFSADDVNSVDALIFAWLSYYRFENLDGALPEGLTLRELARLHERRNGAFQENHLKSSILPSLSATWLLRCASRTRRFGSVRVCDFVRVTDHEKSVQFAAVSFLVGKKLRVIAYRGTDSSVAGWKEDCYLSFQEAVPAQLLGLQYLQDAADGREVLLCGHSKGGNLAVYAALHAPEARLEDIKRVYNFDGPGFCVNTLNEERHRRIRERVRTIIPESSVVGMLLEHDEDYLIVESQKVGLLQHDAMFWKVIGRRFVYSEKLNASSVLLDRALRSWIKSMSNEERKDFVDALFAIIESTGAKQLTELSDNILINSKRMLATATALNPDQKKMALRLVRELVRAARKEIIPMR